MLKTVANKEELENLIIKDIDKIVLYTTIKDVKTGEESEIQIDITNCHDAAIMFVLGNINSNKVH